MSQMRMGPSLKKFANDLEELSASSSWSDLDEKLEVVCSTVKKSDLEKVCLDSNVFNIVFADSNRTRGWNRSHWMAQKVLAYVLPMHVEIGDKILKESDVDLVKTLVIQKGIYTDISLIDEVATNGSGDSQVMAVTFCSIKALRKLKGHKSKKVRKIYYNRLGPVECLDEMITDKIKDIRYDGVSRAPLGYPKLDSMIKEIARDVFNVLVQKIDIGTLPMLLANRNIKNNWIASRVESRLNSGK